jgi:glycosyltransferase involved in cell wall biosynthesis
MKLRWVGDTEHPSSLSLINKNLIDALRTLGHEITFDPAEDANVEIRHQWPPPLTEPTDAVPVILWQPWEYGPVPAEWVDFANEHCEGVFTYTHWLANWYRDSGLKTWAEKIPLAPSFTPPTDTWPCSKAVFDVLAVGGPATRKNWDILIAAWELLCESYPSDVAEMRLLLKYSPVVYGEIPAEWASLPGVNVITDDFTDEDMRELYRRSHVLVAPIGGEAWCMPLTDAAAVGMHIITTRCEVALEVIPNTPHVSWLETQNRAILQGLPESHADSDVFILRPGRLRIALEMLMLKKRHAMSHFENIPPREQRYTWEASAQTIIDTLRRLGVAS